MGRKPIFDSTTVTPIAQYVAECIERSGVSLQHLAKQLDYSPNYLTMIKNGKAKLPLNRVPELARLIGADKRHMFVLAAREYWPLLADELGILMDSDFPLTENEREIVNELRRASHNSNPPLTPALSSLLGYYFSTQLENKENLPGKT